MNLLTKKVLGLFIYHWLNVFFLILPGTTIIFYYKNEIGFALLLLSVIVDIIFVQYRQNQKNS